jgi:hypothetical protein
MEGKRWFLLNVDIERDIPYPYVWQMKGPVIEVEKTLHKFRFKPLPSKPRLEQLDFPSGVFVPDVMTNTLIHLTGGILCNDRFARVLREIEFGLEYREYKYELLVGGKNQSISYFHFETSSLGHLVPDLCKFIAFNGFSGAQRPIEFFGKERTQVPEVVLPKKLTFLNCGFDLYSFGIATSPLIASELFVDKMKNKKIVGLSIQEINYIT